MAKKKPDSELTQVTLKNVRLGFPHLFEAQSSTEDSAPKFSAAFIIDPTTEGGKDNLRRVIKAIKAVCEAEWDDPEFFKRIKADRVRLEDGNDQISQSSGEIYDGFHDMKVVKATSPEKRRPQLVDRRREHVREEDEELYAGCYVNAVVRFYSVTDRKKGGNGVFCSLEGVQKFREGPPFGAGPLDVESAFDDLGDDDFGDETGGDMGDDDLGI